MREMCGSRGRLALMVEAASAWAAVRAAHIPARLLRDGEDRLAVCIAAEGCAFEHISSDRLELRIKRTPPRQSTHTTTQ